MIGLRWIIQYILIWLLVQNKAFIKGLDCECDCVMISILIVLIPALSAVAFLTLFERHLIGTLQRRAGPNLVWIYGSGQAVADALKLMIRELILPCIANRSFFWFAPFLTLWWALLLWIIVPFGENQLICDLDFGLIFLYAVAALGSYGILVSGWASNSKYAFYGAVRSVSQMISYEVSLGILWFNILMITSKRSR